MTKTIHILVIICCVSLEQARGSENKKDVHEHIREIRNKHWIIVNVLVMPLFELLRSLIQFIADGENWWERLLLLVGFIYMMIVFFSVIIPEEVEELEEKKQIRENKKQAKEEAKEIMEKKKEQENQEKQKKEQEAKEIMEKEQNRRRLAGDVMQRRGGVPNSVVSVSHTEGDLRPALEMAAFLLFMVAYRRWRKKN